MQQWSMVYLVPHPQQVPVTRRFRCVRLEVEPELEMVGELLLRWGLVLIQQDRVMMAALQPPLVGFHPAGWVLLLQQIAPWPWLAILVERNPVDRAFHLSWLVFKKKRSFHLSWLLF